MNDPHNPDAELIEQTFYVYSGFRKDGVSAGSFAVGYFAGEPTVNSEAEAKVFAETRIGLDQVVIQVRRTPPIQ